MSIISFILNIPYTIVGLVVGVISIPKKIQFHKYPYVIIITCQSFWWTFGYKKKSRAMTAGCTVLLDPHTMQNDLKHELIHVEQHIKFPLIFPFLYYIELFKNGYRKNKYEEEAYEKAKNSYIK